MGIVVLPFCQKDQGELENLLRWIAELGRNEKHQALLLADDAVDYRTATMLLGKAKDAFGAVALAAVKHVDGWIAGSNALFEQAATRLAGHPFLWIEPDAVPLKAGWLDMIFDEYQKCGKPFMGALVNHDTPGQPNPYLEGCSVYPADCWTRLSRVFNPEISWTLACAGVTVPHTHPSPLFQHFWGQPGLVPTFTDRKGPDSPTNTLTLQHIKSEAVLFHRNKDGSLIELLREKLGLRKAKRIVVVFPVCSKDIAQAMQHSLVLLKMNHKSRHRAMIAFDQTIPTTIANRLANNLHFSFQSVELFRYNCPTGHYPQGANIAWQTTAVKMMQSGEPWFWCEADGVALKPDWVEQLQLEYDRGGQPFMGVIVPCMDHLQGTSIYPADTPKRMPRAMAAREQAFDMEGQHETKTCRHDGSRLIFHIWTLHNGNPLPVGGGTLPVGITAEQLKRWLPKEAVYLHRIKDRSVLELILSGQYQH